MSSIHHYNADFDAPTSESRQWIDGLLTEHTDGTSSKPEPEYGLKVDYRQYQCTNCGNKQNLQTNHTGPCSAYCHSCSWKRPQAGHLIPALGGHTYLPFEYVGPAVFKEWPGMETPMPESTTRRRIDRQFEGTPETISWMNEEGEVIKATVGQPIGFKADVEQYSIVKAIDHGEWRWSIPKVQVDIHDGHYAGKNKWIPLDRCFPEGM